MNSIWPLRRTQSSENFKCYRRNSRSSWQYERLSGDSGHNVSYGSRIDCDCPIDGTWTCSNCLNSSKSKNVDERRRRQMSITVTDSGEHCHDDEAQKQIDKKARQKLWLASLVCVIFMIVEAVGGILAGSLAVATDAAHLLTDFAGFMISLFALYIAERPATKRLSYGYHRAEVIGALTSVLLIWVVTGILIYMAIQRIINKSFEIDAVIMLITSGVGLIVNIIMGCTLHQHAHTHGGGGGHGHGHGHSHGGRSGHAGVSSPHQVITTTDESGKVSSVTLPRDEEEGGGVNGKNGIDETDDNKSNASSDTPGHVHRPNINVRAAFIHVIGDFLQSVGVFIAALVIYFKPDWAIVDPICTFLFSVLVLGTTYAIVTDTVVVLMEGIPKGIDFNEVRETLLGVKGVCKVHNLRIWSLSMDRMALSTHLAVDPKYTGTQILRKSSQNLKAKYGFSEVTIQIEYFSESMQDCLKCQELN